MGRGATRRPPRLLVAGFALAAGYLAAAPGGAHAQDGGDRQVVAAPPGPGETAVDVRAGATVVLGGGAFAGAALAVDDDDLVVALPGGDRTLILGGFFARGQAPARLAVGDAPPVPADEVAAGLAAGSLGRVPALPTRAQPVQAQPTRAQPARAQAARPTRSAAASPARPASPAVAPPPATGVPGGPIRRVVKFVDPTTAELPGFGAYAYVVLPGARDRAAEEGLLAAMFTWERRHRSDAPAARRVTFYLPVSDAAAARRGYDEAMPISAPDRREVRAWRRTARRLLAADGYDRVRARETLSGLCGPEGDGPPPCRGVASGGPYLLITALPMPRGAPPAEPYLLVDLAGHGGAGLARWVAALAELTLDEGASAAARLERVRAAADAVATELGGREGGGAETVFLAPSY